MIVSIVAIILLTMASAYFSCSEVTFFSLSSSKVRSFRSSPDVKKQNVARILSRSKNLLVTIFMYNTIVNVLLQNTSSDLFSAAGDNWLLKVGFPLILVLIVGELIPKYLGLIHNERLAPFFAPGIEWFGWIISPLRAVITRISFVLSRLFFFFLKSESALSKEELVHILDSSEGKGILHKDEAELIYGVLNLEDKQVSEIMRPRNEMAIFDIQEPISKLVYLFSDEKLSEVALFEMPQEHMLGVIRIRDFFIKRDMISAPKDLLKIVRKPLFVPETTSAGALLAQLRNYTGDTAWVVDEYGTTCGMITENDLLQDVVGKKSKSSDEKPEYERLSKDTIVANGTMTLDDIRSLFAVDLSTKYHMVTIGGFITEKLGTIPTVGSELTQGALFMRVLAADQTKVRKVYIQKRPIND